MKNGLITYSDGSKAWYLNGKRHRVDGPAVKYPNGPELWWFNDFLHRENGPAIERPDGTKEWYLNGKRYNKISYYNLMVELGYMTEEEGFLELI